jgi:hypothetical protein
VNSNTLHQGQKEISTAEEQSFSVPSISLSKAGGAPCGIGMICQRYDDKDNAMVCGTIKENEHKPVAT